MTPLLGGKYEGVRIPARFRTIKRKVDRKKEAVSEQPTQSLELGKTSTLKKRDIPAAGEEVCRVGIKSKIIIDHNKSNMTPSSIVTNKGKNIDCILSNGSINQVA